MVLVATANPKTEATGRSRVRRLRVLPVFFMMLALTACVYLGSLQVPFHFDDAHTIQQNPDIRSLSNVPRYFTDASTFSILPENQSYRPLSSLGFALSYWMGSGKVWAFHALKILMHSFCGLFVFLIWRRLFALPGWFPSEAAYQPRLRLPGLHVKAGSELAALGLGILFLIHPANSETVTYICANTHLQASMFYLLAFLVFLHQLGHETSRRGRWAIGASIAYIAAVLTKEEAITFPAMASVTAFLISTESGLWPRCREVLRRTWFYWILFIGLAFLIHEMTPATWAKSRGNVPRLDYFMTQWRAWLWYMRLWIWPWDLNADNVGFGFSNSFFDPRVIQAMIGNVLLIGFAYWKRRSFPALIFGLIWFFVTVSPASSVMPLAEPVNEHRMYLAYGGFSGAVLSVVIWLVWTALRPGISPRWATAIVTLAVLCMLVGTTERVRVWRTAESLWTDTVSKNPGSGRALNNLALVYMGRGEYSRALELLDRCEKSWTGYVYCPINKGVIYLTLKDMEGSKRSLGRALQLDPDNIFANYYEGKFYEDIKKDPERAIFYYQRADDLSEGRHREARIRLASLRSRAGG